MPYHLSDFEVIVDPLIFDIRLRGPNHYGKNNIVNKIQFNADEFEKDMNLVLNKFGANSYTYHNFYKTFGFNNLTREESLQQAILIQESIKELYSDKFEVDLGFSTLGLKEHSDFHKNILNYINTPDFEETMGSYIRFLDITEYDKWMGAS